MAEYITQDEYEAKLEWQRDELSERLDMMCRMFNDTYLDALEFKDERDELLVLLKEAAVCIPLVDLRNRIDKTINKIEGDE